MAAFYLQDGPDRFLSQPSTAGPWGPDSQHGGPPAALLGRAIEGLVPDGSRTVGRVTVELLGPVPVGPLRVSATEVRPGRSVSLVEAMLYDEQRDRPAGWSGGYLDAVAWRWIVGSVGEPGPGVVWMRPPAELVAGEPISPLQRLLACVDSASGASTCLDPADCGFLNTELTVHVLRRPWATGCASTRRRRSVSTDSSAVRRRELDRNPQTNRFQKVQVATG